MLRDLSKNELLRLTRLYNKYIQEFFEEEIHEGMIPVCIEEFFDNEYQEILEVGDIVNINYTEDEDMAKWLEEQEEKGIYEFRVKEIDEESGLFWIENCEYAIWLTDDWSRVIEKSNNKETNYYLRKKFIQEFNVERLIDEIMDLCNQEELNKFIVETFRENIDFEEYRQIFNDLSDDEFISCMEDLGFYYTIEEYNRICGIGDDE